MNKNYYDILGVDKNADDKQIKEAFRNLSKKYHPDINKDPDATEKFKEINEAYQVLSDKEKRNNYDMFGDPNGNSGGFNPFADMDFFNMFGRNRHSRGEMKERGTDLRITVNISMEEAYNGVHKKIKIKKDCTCHRCHGSGSEDNSYGTCSACNGTGYKRVRTTSQYGYNETITPCPNCKGTGKSISNPCSVCNGTGLEHGEQEVEFDVPKGMPFEAYFVLQGKGNDGPHRGIPGDLIVIVNQSEEDKKTCKLVRDGNDILYNLKVNYKDLIYGCDIDVPYITGTQKIHIPEGTESGKVISLYRKGFPDPTDPTIYGTYKITIECIIPKASDLNEKQKKALNNFIESISK